MKPEVSIDNSVKVYGAKNTNNFGISDIGKVLSILRDQMYQNKLKALVQEITSNGRDACRIKSALITDFIPEVNVRFINMSNEKDMINKYVNNDFNRNLYYLLDNATKTNIVVASFEDNGIGMSEKVFDNIYSQYGGTTKDGTNDQTGGFGLGAKVPFSYVKETNNKFLVDSCHKGIRNIWLCYIDDSGEGKTSLLDTTDLGDENISFTKVQLIIENRDHIDELINYCNYTQLLWKESENINVIKFGSIVPLAKVKTKLQFISKDFEEYKVEVHLFDDMSSNYPDSFLIIAIDGISYSMSLKELRHLGINNQYFYNDSYKNKRLVINMGNGLIIPHPSREILTMDNQTINIIKDILLEYSNSILKNIKDEYESLPLSPIIQRQMFAQNKLYDLKVLKTFYNSVDSHFLSTEFEQKSKQLTYLRSMCENYFKLTFKVIDVKNNFRLLKLDKEQNALYHNKFYENYNKEKICVFWDRETKLTAKIKELIIASGKRFVLIAKVNGNNFINSVLQEQIAYKEDYSKTGLNQQIYINLNTLDMLEDSYGIKFSDFDDLDETLKLGANKLSIAPPIKKVKIKKEKVVVPTNQSGFNITYIGKGDLNYLVSSDKNIKFNQFVINRNDENCIYAVSGNISIDSVKKFIYEYIQLNESSITNIDKLCFIFNERNYFDDTEAQVYCINTKNIAFFSVSQFTNNLENFSVHYLLEARRKLFTDLETNNVIDNKFFIDATVKNNIGNLFALELGQKNFKEFFVPIIQEINNKKDFLEFSFGIKTNPIKAKAAIKNLLNDYYKSINNINYSLSLNNYVHYSTTNALRNTVSFIYDKLHPSLLLDKEFMNTLAEIKTHLPDFSISLLEKQNLFNIYNRDDDRKWFFNFNSKDNTRVDKDFDVDNFVKILIKLFDDNFTVKSNYTDDELSILQYFKEVLEKRALTDIEKTFKLNYENMFSTYCFDKSYREFLNLSLFLTFCDHYALERVNSYKPKNSIPSIDSTNKVNYFNVQLNIPILEIIINELKFTLNKILLEIKKP